MKYKAVALDVDGTITSHISSWQYIHEKLGSWHNRADAHQEKFLAGEISYRRFCELDAAEWKGMDEDNIKNLFKKIPYSSNFRECVRWLKGAGFKIAAVSTGLQYIPEKLMEEFSFNGAAYNRLLSKNGRLTGEVQIEVSHDGKGPALKNILKELRTTPEETIGVGDSEGDIQLAEECGYFIAYNSSSPKLSKIADYVCASKDFREVADAVFSAAKIK